MKDEEIKICYIQFHNILRLFDVLPNLSFTTNETILYYYLQKLYKIVAFRVDNTT